MSRCLRAAMLTLVTVATSLLTQAPAWAQDSDEWSFVLTPQVWLSHIAKNGFAAPPNSKTMVSGFLLISASEEPDQFPSKARPKNDINPQWGLQLAAQKGRLTLAGAFQFVDFTTYNEITFESRRGLCINAGCVEPGQRWAREAVDMTRFDIDVAASYFFPGVVGDSLDASIGAGFKFIYAGADRRFTRLSPAAATAITSLGNFTSNGLYMSCDTPCTHRDAALHQHVKERSYLYGLTIPMNAAVRLTNDATWLLPVSIAPMIGGETRDDYGVVYDVTLPQDRFELLDVGFRVNRKDGTTFAYGATADASIRWLLNEALSVYAGMRVQYIKGHDTYLAYGPLFGMSFRFGTR
jgi:hypothetical protein